MALYMIESNTNIPDAWAASNEILDSDPAVHQLAADGDLDGGWVLIDGPFDTAQRAAEATGGRAYPPRAGRYMSMSGAVVYVNHDGEVVESASQVLHNLAWHAYHGNGPREALEAFRELAGLGECGEYDPDIVIDDDLADEALQVMGRAF